MHCFSMTIDSTAVFFVGMKSVRISGFHVHRSRLSEPVGLGPFSKRKSRISGRVNWARKQKMGRANFPELKEAHRKGEHHSETIFD